MTQQKKSLFWYDFTTFMGVMLGTASAIALSGVAVGLIIGGMVVFWWANRLQNRPIHDQFHLRDSVERFQYAVNMFNQQLADSDFIGQKLCPTCQTQYTDETLSCAGLQDILKHRPKDAVPSPNPYSWAWHKAKGYVPPPDDWPKDRTWIDPLEPDVAAMLTEGRKYYAMYGNELWDMGYGDVPSWYIDAHVKRMVNNARV